MEMYHTQYLHPVDNLVCKPGVCIYTRINISLQKIYTHENKGHNNSGYNIIISGFFPGTGLE